MALYTPEYQPTGEEIAVIETSKGTIRVPPYRMTSTSINSAAGSGEQK